MEAWKRRATSRPRGGSAGAFKQVAGHVTERFGAARTIAAGVAEGKRDKLVDARPAARRCVPCGGFDRVRKPKQLAAAPRCDAGAADQ